MVHRNWQTACPGQAVTECRGALCSYRGTGRPLALLAPMSLQAARAITCAPPELRNCRLAGQSLRAAYRVFRPSVQHVHQIFQFSRWTHVMWLAGGTQSTPRSAIWPTGPLALCSCAQPNRGGEWLSSSLRGAPTGDQLANSARCQVETQQPVLCLPHRQAAPELACTCSRGGQGS